MCLNSTLSPLFEGTYSKDIAAWNVWGFPANIFIEDFYAVVKVIFL